MEKIFALLERFVTAHEVLAVSLQRLSKLPLADLPPAARGVSADESDEVAPQELRSAANLAPGGDRDYASKEYADLVELATKRGITVPARTRSATIVKQLQDWDARADADAAKVLGKPETTFAKTEPGGFPETTTEEDPFGGATEEPAKTYTKEEVLAALQKLMVAESKEAVFKVLQDQGGVKAFKDLPVEKYAAVMAVVAGRI
jgi:hypothetical protein